ncbi:hypothetical protein DQ384_38090 [Sphaerisporangium album]|uniref:Uncharacterized protein n=1 Tax=Sphaerisporangium album TaxID=509200 RepID=A0A367EM97_9ACTN|nr:hypothetical protein DQ384_38090 [Sphaerisporangium album]
MQLEEQRRRDVNYSLIRQLQEVGDLYAEFLVTQDTDKKQVASQRLLLRLPLIPARYAALLKQKMQVEIDGDSAAEGARRMHELKITNIVHISNVEIYRELAQNITELLGPATLKTTPR